MTAPEIETAIMVVMTTEQFTRPGFQFEKLLKPNRGIGRNYPRQFAYCRRHESPIGAVRLKRLPGEISFDEELTHFMCKAAGTPGY